VYVVRESIEIPTNLDLFNTRDYEKKNSCWYAMIEVRLACSEWLSRFCSCSVLEDMSALAQSLLSLNIPAQEFGAIHMGPKNLVVDFLRTKRNGCACNVRRPCPQMKLQSRDFLERNGKRTRGPNSICHVETGFTGESYSIFVRYLVTYQKP
jgi:hypothetical protein